MKNMHYGSPSDPWGPWGQDKLIYVHYIDLQGNAKLSTSKLSSVFHHLPCIGPKQLCALFSKNKTQKLCKVLEKIRNTTSGKFLMFLITQTECNTEWPDDTKIGKRMSSISTCSAKCNAEQCL